ncbi:unnamed protein product [Closterium sp. NIES-53]
MGALGGGGVVGKVGEGGDGGAAADDTGEVGSETSEGDGSMAGEGAGAGGSSGGASKSAHTREGGPKGESPPEVDLGAEFTTLLPPSLRVEQDIGGAPPDAEGAISGCFSKPECSGSGVGKMQVGVKCGEGAHRRSESGHHLLQGNSDGRLVRQQGHGPRRPCVLGPMGLLQLRVRQGGAVGTSCSWCNQGIVNGNGGLAPPSLEQRRRLGRMYGSSSRPFTVGELLDRLRRATGNRCGVALDQGARQLQLTGLGDGWAVDQERQFDLEVDEVVRRPDK